MHNIYSYMNIYKYRIVFQTEASAKHRPPRDS